MNPQQFEENSQTIEERLFVFIKFLLLKKKLILITYALSIAIAVIFAKSVKKEYKSSLTGFSNYLKANQIKNIVSDLGLLLKANKQEDVAQKLGLSLEKIKSLKKIEVFDQTEIYKKISDDDINFQINVVVTDMEILDSLEASLTNYISNINFVKRRLQMDKIDLTDERDVLKREIKYIDSAKFLLLSKINSADNKGVILSNLGEVITTKMELDRKLKENDKKLRFIEDFQIIKSFDKSYNKIFPKLSIILLISLVLATVFLYTYFFVQRVSKYSDK